MLLHALALTLALTAPPGLAAATRPVDDVIVRGKGITITAEELRERIEEQSPFLRVRYNTLERKQEFVRNLIRFEVLAREAERLRLYDDPDVLQTFKKFMVQKLVQKRFAEGDGPAIEETEIRRHYEDHGADYRRPRRVRAALVVVEVAAGSAARTRALAVTRKAAARLAKDPQAFETIGDELSAKGVRVAKVDAGLQTAEELERVQGKEVAQAVLALAQGQVSGVIATDRGITLARAIEVQPEVQRTLEEVRPQITARLARERKQAEFEAWVAALVDAADVSVDNDALDRFVVPAASASPPPTPPRAEAPPAP